MREGWKEVELGEVCKVKGGKRLPKGHELQEEITDHPYIRARDIGNGKINFDQPVYLNDLTFEKISRYIVNTDDVIITIVGANIGDVAYVTNQFDGASLTENAVKLIANRSILNPLYLKYALVPKYMKQYFQTVASGAAQDKLGLYKINKIKIHLPPLETQRKIASILSSYDDLIENNLKRIKLLEEKAQLTYEEWFVKMRFPGYETAVFDEVTGLPEGWEKVKVGSLIGKVKSTTKIKSSEILPKGIIPVIDQSRDFIAGYTNDESSLVDIAQPLIVFGDHTRVLKFVNFNFARGADGTQLVLSNSDRMPQHLFYHVLMNIDLSNYHYARHFKFLKDSEIILSNLNTANEYEKNIKPVFDSIKVLRNQNRLLKEARDILLPRLMSGMIDVENIVIQNKEPKELQNT